MRKPPRRTTMNAIPPLHIARPQRVTRLFLCTILAAVGMKPGVGSAQTNAPVPAAPAPAAAPAPPQEPSAKPEIEKSGTPPRTLAEPGAPPPPPGVSSAPPVTGMIGEVESKLMRRFEEFFRNVKRGESAFAYARLLEGSKLAQKRDTVADLTADTDQTLRHVGRLADSELVSVTSASRTLKELVFIANCEHQPVRWRFVCYSTGGRWHVLKVDLSDDIERMFGFAAMGPDEILPAEPDR
jgi:hypothetical protein